LICPWHGLRLDGGREFGWKPLPAHDDGVLVWVRLDKVGGEAPLDAPVLPARPTGPTLAAVTRLEGVCEPRDVISNRLDPWHGGWFHPYSFAQLEVLSAPPVDADDAADLFQVAVTFRMGRLGMPVVAEFTAKQWPTRRSPVLPGALEVLAEADVTKARRIVAAMKEAEAQGKGAVSLDGRLIDYASIRQAEVLVKKAEQIAGA
jgi:hypothetical protein